MPSAAEKCHEPSGNHQGISHCLESDHPVYKSTLSLYLSNYGLQVDVASLYT